MSNPAVFDDSDKDDKDFILGDYCDMCQKLRKGNMKRSLKVAMICPCLKDIVTLDQGREKFMRKYTLLYISCLLIITCLNSKQKDQQLLLPKCFWTQSGNPNTALNTLPSMKNLLHIEPLFEAMDLNAIVEEMMDENI